MTFSLLSPFVRAFLCGAAAVSALTFIAPASISAQENTSRQDACKISQNLKPTKTVPGIYTDEAARKGVEGTVVLCVTVDANGRVTNVDALSGPSELFQPSVDAAKQWQLEPPPKAPASTKIEMRCGFRAMVINDSERS